MAIAVFSCNDGIDPIAPVAPGEDMTAPVVAITYPKEGTLVRLKQDVGPITMQFESVDDIEIKKIDVILDGQTINTFDSFIDYRRAVISYTYPSLENGTHTLEVKATDLSDKVSSKVVDFEKVEPYQPLDGEIFYMPFDDDYFDLVSITEPTVVGTPSFSDVAKAGKSYKGAAGAYLSADATDLMGDEFSAAFWYKIDATPDRAGVLTISPPDPGVDKPNKRTSGFRLLREADGSKQTFKLNIGTGDNETWVGGGAATAIDPSTTTGWVHIAITISQSKAAMYLNGIQVASGDFAGVDWTDCTKMSIASGAPNFVGWDHLSDLSLYDDLRIFNKALTAEEVLALME